MKKIVFAAFAALALGLFVSTAKAELMDVPDHHWAKDAVFKLEEMGIIKGYPDGTFKGERPMTRYEYALVVERLIDWVKEYHAGNLPEFPAAKGDGNMDEVLAIIDKLKEEFRDELAALKVDMEQVKNRVSALEEKSSRGLANIDITGSLRQRVDMLNSDLTTAQYGQLVTRGIYEELGAGASNDFDPGYEANPNINITAGGGPGVTYAMGLSAYINNQGTIAKEDHSGASTGVDSLSLQYAYADIDFSKSASELDTLKLKVGYQDVLYGEYGLLVDNSGATSNPAVRLDLGKDRVSLSAIVGSLSFGGSSISGLGSTSANDTFAAGRIGVDLDAFDFGVTFLGNGLQEEQGWGVDLNLPLLNNSDFLKNARGEYTQITDTQANTAIPNTIDDDSFIVGLDVYRTSNSSLEFSYAKISPFVSGHSGVDHNPFTEFDAWSPDAASGAAGQMNYSFDSGRIMFPDDFEGIGLKASHRILGNTIVSAKAWAGDINSCSVGECGYPGVGAVELLKPINDQTAFRVEYMQQGLDDVVLNRVRGELTLNF